MTADSRNSPSVLMLGTFGLQPKATLRSRAMAIAQTLSPRMSFGLITTPWDNSSDSGRRWIEHGIPVANTHVVSPVLFPLAMAEMVRESHLVRPDLIHLFKPKGFGDLAARWLTRRLPIVVDMDDWEGDGGWNEIGGYNLLQRRLFDWQERTWPGKAGAVTVASRELERRAVQLGANRSRVFYVPNGLTAERYAALAQGSDPRSHGPARRRGQDQLTIALYTRFVEYDPRFVVHVLKRVLRRHSNVKLVVIGKSGDGAAERILRSTAHEAGIAQAIDLRGWVQSQDIPNALSGADVAIHPFDDNRVNRAKCSVKVLELMAASIPVVTSTVGENAEMVINGDSGFLVPPADVEAMATAVTTVLGNSELASKLGSNAQQRVHQRYLWQHLAPRVEVAYSEALRFRSRDRSPVQQG